MYSELTYEENTLSRRRAWRELIATNAGDSLSVTQLLLEQSCQPDESRGWGSTCRPAAAAASKNYAASERLCFASSASSSVAGTGLLNR